MLVLWVPAPASCTDGIAENILTLLNADLFVDKIVT